MIKILKIAGIVIASVSVLAILGGVIFVKTFDVNKFKPQIVSQAKSALGREFDFDKARLDISFSRGVSLELSGLSIGEDPAFAKGEFLTVKNVSVSVDILGFIFGGKISVPGVLIESPVVTIIRGKDGTINAQTIAKPAGPSTAVTAGRSASGPSTPAPAALPVLAVSSFRISGGTIKYIDNMFDPPVSIEAGKLDVTVTGFSLDKPFPFTVSVSLLSAEQNISVTGQMRLDLAANQVTVSSLKASTELGALSLDKIPAALPMLKGVPLPSKAAGKIALDLDKLVAGSKGLGDIAAGVAVSDGSVEMKELSAPVKGITAAVAATASDVMIEKFSAGIGTGKLSCSGKIEGYAAAQVFNVSVNIADIKVQDLMPGDKAPVQFEGSVSGPVTCSGKGFGPDALRSNLSGTATVTVANGVLKGTNVLRAVLGKIDVIPGLSQIIAAGLPESYQRRLDQANTVFSEIKLPVAIEKGRFIVKEAVIDSQEFIFKGSVEAGFGGAFIAEGALSIPQDLSASMAGKAPQLRYLFNADNQIYIPLKISGDAVKVSFEVDKEYIAKKVVQNQVDQQLDKALDKVFGKGSEGGESSGASDQKAAAKEAVSDLLGNIFKKK